MLATAYLTLLVVMAVLDGCWLGFIAKDFYQRGLGPLMAERIKVPAALAFYLLYAAGLTAMAVRPMLETGDWRAAALRGGGLGLFAYMTYDLSNLATLKGVPASLAIVDILWGGAISATVCAAAVFVAQRVFG